MIGCTVRRDHREHAGRQYVVAVLELGDGSRLIATERRGQWWVGSSDGTAGWMHVMRLVQAGVLRPVHRGPECFGHTDYALEVAP